TLEHNTDLFDGATAERLAAGFVALLEAAVAEPGRALAELPLGGAGDLARRPKEGAGHPLRIRGFRAEAPATRRVAAPTNPLEAGLAAIWAGVLQLDHFGIDDDFFALGGHSLLATQVVTRVREELGLELPLRRVFEEPTIRRLAQSLAPPLALAVRLAGALSVETLARALAQWARQGAAPELPVLDLSAAPEEAREEWARQLALEEARHPFDPEGGARPRLGLLRLGEREHLLLVSLSSGLAQGAPEGELRDQIEALAQRAVERERSGASHGPPPHIHIFSDPGERTTMDLTTRLRLAYYRARGAFRQALSAGAERQDRRDFAAFYRGLERREDIVYMFFTSDLLHWLDRALAFVPPEVNVVLIGSDLTADEIAWIRSHYRRPFHHIRSRVDDITVMEFVFQMAEHNFGWLHVDCFVLNPSLFAEMAAVAEDVVANCIWSHPIEGSSETALHSAFVVFNFAVIQKLRASGLEVSPSTYNYRGGPKGRTITHRKLYNRVPTPRHVELLRRVLPPGFAGLPEYPLRDGYFQVMVLYQLVANALGYRLHHVRELLRDGTGSAQSFSDEIVHVNGVATYKRYKDAGDTVGGRFYALLLQADYVLLAGLGGEAPPRYRQLRGELEAELERLQIPRAAVQRNLRAFLAERGIGEDRLNRIVGPGGNAAARAVAGGTLR
ncbi:MAG TPA: phosphopantetheine-binding protein, partial [Thermoanaerobaculia bacterium]|nr:phosphopantetheine-binding protein [Thermoanaerobaculia bacterium]